MDPIEDFHACFYISVNRVKFVQLLDVEANHFHLMLMRFINRVALIVDPDAAASLEHPEKYFKVNNLNTGRLKSAIKAWLLFLLENSQEVDSGFVYLYIDQYEENSPVRKAFNYGYAILTDNELGELGDRLEQLCKCQQTHLFSIFMYYVLDLEERFESAGTLPILRVIHAQTPELQKPNQAEEGSSHESEEGEEEENAAASPKATADSEDSEDSEDYAENIDDTNVKDTEEQESSSEDDDFADEDDADASEEDAQADDDSEDRKDQGDSEEDENEDVDEETGTDDEDE